MRAGLRIHGRILELLVPGVDTLFSTTVVAMVAGIAFRSRPSLRPPTVGLCHVIPVV